MIEIPESLHLAKQLNQTLEGRTINQVSAWQSPHKLAFIFGDPSKYDALFLGKTFHKAHGFGSWVEMVYDDSIFAVSEDTGLLYTVDEKKLPQNHQMLFSFDDGSFLCAKVKMYGALVGAKPGEYDNQYYIVARDKPSIFSETFGFAYFKGMISDEKIQKLSLKAFLATEQRIPGLGNGVLQDILYNCKLHPKEKVNNITTRQRDSLYHTIITTLKEMADNNGRDTEKDLFSQKGKYQTKMSKNSVGKTCDRCGSVIIKKSYLGGSIYFCDGCQNF